MIQSVCVCVCVCVCVNYFSSDQNEIKSLFDNSNRRLCDKNLSELANRC